MSFNSTQYASSMIAVLRTLIFTVAVASLLVLSSGGAGGQTVEDDHGDDFDTATLVELGSSVDGRIEPGDDRDVFKIDLSDATRPTDLWVYTLGELDTFGGLYDATGNLIELNDDSFFADNIRAFSIRSVVQPGVYYVIAVGFLGEPGDYTFHAQAVDDTGGTIETAKSLGLGSRDGGTINTPSDEDYFKLDFSESKHVIIDAVSANISLIDAVLLDADGNEISANIYPVRVRGSGSLFPIGFTIEEDFELGTYYLRVTNPIGRFFHPDSFRPEPYSVFFLEDTEYTELVDDCESQTDALNKPQIKDPLYACQWHLNSTEWQDINVESTWADGVKGEGVKVAVVDDGMYYEHEDLKDNVDTSLNFDYVTGGNDIYGRFDHHGTHVAGMIAARDNDIGVRGVAPRATIYGYNLLGVDFMPSTATHAMFPSEEVAAETAVVNNSWGEPDGPGFEVPNPFWRLAIERGITEGDNGKGIFYVFAAGNGHLRGDDSNLEEYTNDYGVTAACSVNRHGTRAGYSEMGANLWVCAPSNDRPGFLGGVRGILTTENSDRYYQDFGGTSAAAPIVSGVAALTRDANPDLTWRDIKVILAASAQKNDAASTGWDEGAPMHPVSSTERYSFNHEYGFGVVNAQGAVDLAKRWTNLPATNETSEGSEVLNAEIPDAPAIGAPERVTNTLTVDTGIKFTEFVEVNVYFAHDSFRDLEILLESPSGKISRLAVPFDTYNGLSSFFGEAFVPLYGSFQFGSAKHLGEDPNGEWKLHVTDHIPVVDGTFIGFSITVYGHERAPGAAALDSVAVNPGGEALDVAWSAPDENGDSDIVGYDVRYIPTDADETDPSNWNVLESVWTADSGEVLEYTVTGLTDGTAYGVQVRAVNSAGGGMWSETITGTPMTSQCVSGGAVIDRDNAHLIYDCEALLEARDTLAGTDSSRFLNWQADTPIANWYGVVLSDTTQRVTELRLHGRNANQETGTPEEKLNGTIPAELGGLSELTLLYLHRNNLAGEVPSALSDLSKLRVLYLYDNKLTEISDELGPGLTALTRLFAHRNDLAGEIPSGLTSIPNLDWLTLYDNELTGAIPADLSSLANLRRLYLHRNELNGPIPGELGNMSSLTHLLLPGNDLNGAIPAELGELGSLVWLSLEGNDLSGVIPPELGRLPNLQQLILRDNKLTGRIPSELGDLEDSLVRWRLRGNRLTGCVPAGLAAVTDNDLASLSLPVCQ